ncbi:hypothetical protein GCM10007082_24720 [Oceanisphaera arctica]|nr:hypothetical protein GCM10007082_24720 [Oceanisphaera arctica]
MQRKERVREGLLPPAMMLTPPPRLPLANLYRYVCRPAAKGEEQIGASSNSPALFACIALLC